MNSNNDKNINFAKLEQIINSKKRIILSTHVNPDGDGLGSEIAFYNHLTSLGIDCKIINLSPTPPKLEFIDTDKVVNVYNENLDKWILKSDLIIAFDIGDYSRLLKLGEITKGRVPALCFDHHPLLRSELYTYTLVDVESPATGYTVWKYLKEFHYKKLIPLNIANPLYVSLISDTGSFKYENTTSDTHLMAANLIDSGVDSYIIQKKIYDTNSLAHVMLLGYVVNNMNFDFNSQVVWAYLDDDILAKFNASSDDIDGITDYLRAIDTVEVSFLIRKISDSDVKVNFRSQDTTINDIASIFKGGGHKFAAGAFVKNGNVEEIKNIILDELRKKIT
ncbi:MAG: hypothetical protein CMF80_06305 [Candidatus Marinimicrobia bacterium]|nr:hypothetical protein [Candidatus Neomarinimicrobiota bacterium]|tara:strand:- start:12851 stop:13855 length:1005 start_codon:yes stop_codon:yes gene_type:complete